MTDVIKELEDGLLRVAHGSACICEVHEDVLTRAIHEIKRLRRLLESCVYGMEPVELGDGRVIVLHLPNKGQSFASIKQEIKRGSPS